MKISKFVAPILGLPMVLGAGLSMMVSCKNTKTNKFETDTWSNVVTHANQGLAHLKQYYGLNSFVGLERKIKIYGVEHTVRVVGENEDYLADSDGKAQLDKPVALTFQFADIVSSKDESSGDIYPLTMRYSERSGFSYWGASDVNKFLTGTGIWQDDPRALIAQLKQQLGDNAIKTVSKFSMFMDSSDPFWQALPNSETVFLPSIAEIYNYGQVVACVGECFRLEGQLAREPGVEPVYREPYSYYRQIIDQNDKYAARKTRLHKELTLATPNGYYEPYWLRSSCVEDFDPEENMCYALSILYDGRWEKIVNTDRQGVAPIFCI